MLYGRGCRYEFGRILYRGMRRRLLLYVPTDGSFAAAVRAQGRISAHFACHGSRCCTRVAKSRPATAICQQQNEQEAVGQITLSVQRVHYLFQCRPTPKPVGKESVNNTQLQDRISSPRKLCQLSVASARAFPIPRPQAWEIRTRQQAFVGSR